MYGPVVVGTRFRLRPPRMEDAPAMITWFEDMEVTSGLRVRFPLSADQEQDWLRHAAADPDGIYWAIEHEGRVVGSTSIQGIDWKNLHGTTGTLIGDRKVWGRGIAGEMIRLRADFAFTYLPLHKLKSGYLEGNEASRRAQLGAGYREVGRRREEFFRDGGWVDEIVTELLREDWERLRGKQPEQVPAVEN